MIVLAAPPKLSAAEKKAVDAIADRVDAFVAGVEVESRAIAEEVLRDIFDDDARAMVAADRATNPKLALLLQRVEATDGLAVGTFVTLLRVVGYDHLVRGRYWKLIKPKVKERLLPLVAPDAPTSARSLAKLNQAAAHAAKFDLDPDTAALWVRQQLRTDNRKPRHNATKKTYVGQLSRAEDLFGSEDGVAHLTEVADRLSPEEVEELEQRLERTARAMLEAAKQLKGRGRRK